MFFFKKKPNLFNHSLLSSVPTPADQALIFICEKCGKKLNADPKLNPALLLQQSLKKEIKEKNLKGHVRAVASSCLDICPENKIAIGISYGEKAGDAFYTANPSNPIMLKDEILRLSQNKE